MKKFYNLIRNFKLLKKSELRAAFFCFSKKERKIFLGLVIIIFISTIIILQNINKSFMISIPMKGGSISEGIVGSPRFINPILALSDADRDLVSIIYSGLMRKSPDGSLIPDLAEKYEMSNDGLTYTFTLKNKIYFHDGKPVTADDIIFTINEVKDPLIKSSLRGNWDGINVEKIDDKTVKFTLKQPYASFLENATLGIIPKHLWEGSPIELNNANTNPIGSGPYQVSKTGKQSSGLINYFDLTPFNKFALGNPYIKKITLHFYPNENDLISALKKGEINQTRYITSQNAELLKEEKYRVETSVLPRVFGLFFNQNKAKIFTDKNVVQAIDLAINKDKIIQTVLGGFGVVIDDPIPPNMIAYQKLDNNDTSSHEDNLQKAETILAKDGWKKNADGFLEKITTDKKKKTTSIILEFTISTGNTPEIAKSADLIKTDLESIGIKVTIKTFEIGNLNQSVIRPRDYDALLFGQIINRESDLFAFWHSSQRNDPGLNVAMYANTKVDKILEDAFVTLDEKLKIKKYAQFEDEIKKDMPAVFLYSPDFIYIVSKNLEGLSIDHIISPSDRFSNSYLWYTEKDNIWKIFSK